jgi:hypothetical protein
MGYEFEKKRERFSEHDIPGDIREYFDAFAGDQAWNPAFIEKMKRRDPTFTAQLWYGLRAVFERLAAAPDLGVSKKLRALEGMVQNLERVINDARAVAAFRSLLLEVGVGRENLSMSEILRAGYVDEARAIEDLKQDPDAMRPFDYGRDDAPHLSPLHDSRLPGWADEALAEIDRFDILPDPKEEIYAPTPEEKEQIQKGDKILEDVLGEIDRGENKDW